MTPAEFRRTVIEPGAAWTEAVSGIPSGVDAKRWLLAVAIKESDLQHRYQVLSGGAAGPARSWWQGEITGGMVTAATGSRMPASIQQAAQAICEGASVRREPAALWRAIEGHDLLAYALARLLLRSDPLAVPATESTGWTMYNDRLWRPGVPNKPKWPKAWAIACGEYPL